MHARLRTPSLLLAATVLVGCSAATASAPSPSRTPAENIANASPGEQEGTEPDNSTVAPSDVMPNVALVSATGQVITIRDGDVSEPVAGLVAADGESMIRTNPAGDDTTVGWVGLSDGLVTDAITVAGSMRAVALDVSGEFVALVSLDPPSPNGTEIVVVDASGERFRRSYDSELLPEGFANFFVEGGLPGGLFVQEFLDPPDADPDAPRWYQVRVLDLATGDLALPLNLRDKGQVVDEQMLGFSRTHLESAANGLLFTLYRGIADDASDYAFVHTLGFVNGVWCLELPRELSLEWELGGLGLLDDERMLLVASANGYVTEFLISDITDFADPDSVPTARRTVRAWTPESGAGGPAVATSDGVIVVGQGQTLRWLDPDTLTETSSLPVDTQIESLAIADDGSVLVVGLGRLHRIQPKGGAVVASATLPAGFDATARIVELPAGSSAG